MFRRVLAAWEALPPRRQILVALPICWLILFLIHVSGLFPLLSVRRSIEYAFMECVPLALVLTFATQSELARREQAAADESDADSHSGAA